jgi:polyisoprenoid-binding protein YceI
VDTGRAITLDARNTTIAFSVPWIPFTIVRGTFGELHGLLAVPDDDIEHATLSLDVAAASVTTGVALRDRHLRGPRFLDADHTPLISFRSERVIHRGPGLVVDGTLSLRGIERPITARCPLEWNGGPGLGAQLRLCGEVLVPRLDHRVGRTTGLQSLNPLMRVIGRDVRVRVDLVVPATQLLPRLLPALGR